jgi:hypothetical protein
MGPEWQRADRTPDKAPGSFDRPVEILFACDRSALEASDGPGAMGYGQQKNLSEVLHWGP